MAEDIYTTSNFTSLRLNRNVHMTSCFKKDKKRGIIVCLCRYCFPRELQNATTLENEDLRLKRLLGSNYLNAFCILLTALTKSNSDLRILTGINEEYSVKYVAKNQSDIDADAALNAAFKAIKRAYRNRAHRESERPDMTVDQIGKARVRSLLFNMNNFNQVHQTLANYCLLTRGDPFLFSHRTVDLSILPVIAALKQEESTVYLNHTDDGAFGSNKIGAYLKRPPTSTHIALFSFFIFGHHTRKAKPKKKKPAAEYIDDEAEVDSDDENEDSDCEKSDPKKVKTDDESSPKDFIVVLHGFTFRPKRRRNTALKEENHALAALICFVPFGKIEDIYRGKLSAVEAFEEASTLNLVCREGLIYLHNVESVWEKKFAAQERTKARNQALREEAERLHLGKDNSDSTKQTFKQKPRKDPFDFDEEDFEYASGESDDESPFLQKYYSSPPQGLLKRNASTTNVSNFFLLFPHNFRTSIDRSFR